MDSAYRNISLTILAAIIVSLIISLSLEILMVPSYLHTTNRAVNIFDFYERIGINNIYFIGSSQIGSDVDTRIIGQDAYNLGSSGDTPLRRLFELNHLIESRPKKVVLGLTYFELNDSAFDITNEADLILPILGKAKFDSSDWAIIPADVKSMGDINQLTYNRKYIKYAFLNLISKLIHTNPDFRNQTVIWNATNFTNPENHFRNLTNKELIDNLNRGAVSSYVVSEKDGRQKKALNHTIYKLTNAGIQVIIINMPLNSLMSANISKQTKENYFNFLNSTGVKYYNFETSFPPEYFVDLTHLNNAGRKHFTELLCPIVQ